MTLGTIIEIQYKNYLKHLRLLSETLSFQTLVSNAVRLQIIFLMSSPLKLFNFPLSAGFYLSNT